MQGVNVIILLNEYVRSINTIVYTCVHELVGGCVICGQLSAAEYACT